MDYINLNPVFMICTKLLFLNFFIQSHPTILLNELEKFQQLIY